MRLPHPGHARLWGKVPDLADCQRSLMTPAGTLRRNRASVADLPSQDEHRQKTPGDPLTVVRGQLHFGQIEHLAILSSSVAQRIAFYPSCGKCMTVAVCKQAYSCRMRDKMLLNGAAGPDDELWEGGTARPLSSRVPCQVASSFLRGEAARRAFLFPDFRFS